MDKLHFAFISLLHTGLAGFCLLGPSRAAVNFNIASVRSRGVVCYSQRESSFNIRPGPYSACPSFHRFSVLSKHKSCFHKDRLNFYCGHQIAAVCPITNCGGFSEEFLFLSMPHFYTTPLYEEFQTAKPLRLSFFVSHTSQWYELPTMSNAQFKSAQER